MPNQTDRFTFSVKRRKSRAVNADADDVAFRTFLYDEGRNLRSATFATKKLAAKWGATQIGLMEDGVESGAGPEGATLKFRGLVKRYLNDDADGGGKNQTIRHQRVVEWWREQLGEFYLSKITPNRVQAKLKKFAASSCQSFNRATGELADTGRARSPATVNRQLAALKRVFAYACAAGDDEDGEPLLKTNPARQVKMRAEKNTRVRAITDQQVSVLLSKAKESDWPLMYCYILGLLRTGARRSEWLEMSWDRINLKERTAYLPHSKNGEPRYLVLTTDLAAELERIQGGVTHIGGLLFPQEDSPTDSFTLRLPWEKLKKAAGLNAPRDHEDYFRLHDLRHVVATQLIAGGATLEQAGHILGHQSVQSTQRYAHLLKKEKLALVEKILQGRGTGNGDKG